MDANRSSPFMKQSAVAERLALLVLFVAQTLFAAEFTARTTNDSGAGSLRQAVTDANASPDFDNIRFNIPQRSQCRDECEWPSPVLCSSRSRDWKSPPRRTKLCSGCSAHRSTIICCNQSRTSPVRIGSNARFSLREIKAPRGSTLVLFPTLKPFSERCRTRVRCRWFD